MSLANLQTTIDRAWEGRAELGLTTKGEVREAVDAALAAPDYLRDKVALDVTEQAALRATMKAARDAGQIR
jgi:2,3,4,5-tetrahydropyridine-2-carboxylate N-succinyltransferase